MWLQKKQYTGPFRWASCGTWKTSLGTWIQIKIYIVQSCTDMFAQHNLPVMKVAACASCIPVTAIFSTEIQPVLKTEKKMQLQTTKNFVWCSQWIIWWESLGKWYRFFSYVPWIKAVIWQSICFFSGSTLSLVERWRDQHIICKSTKWGDQRAHKFIMQWTFSMMHINVILI